MKRLAWFSAILLCGSVITILLARTRSPGPGRLPPSRIQSSPTPSPEQSLASSAEFRRNSEMNDICIPSDTLSYRGFTVTRSYSQRYQQAVVTIKNGKRLIARQNAPNGLPQSSCFGLYPVLGTKDKQLLVVQTSGGAHCCFHYRIYDFTRSGPRMIFDGGKYPVGDGFDELKFQDIDGDGVMEFTQRVLTFDYCCGLAYSASPQPTVVFKYNGRTRRFFPVTTGFQSFLLKGIEDGLDKTDPTGVDHWVRLFHAVTQYIYAGREQRGWKLFDNESKRGLPDFSSKSEIKTLLAKDPLYRIIHRHSIRRYRR